MADDKPINLVAAFKTKTRKSGKGSAYIEVTATDLIFDPSEKRASAQVAVAIRETIQTALLSGRAPDGSPMPMVSPATADRREARDLQASGAQNRAIPAKPVRVKVLRSSYDTFDRDADEEEYERDKRIRGAQYAEERARRQREIQIKKDLGRGIAYRFRAPRLGYFDPRTYDNDTFGRESGMLAQSLVVVAVGVTWLIKFAGPRARTDKHGSAVQRVFSRINMWTEKAQAQPAIQGALQDLSKNLFATSQRALASIRQTVDAAVKIHNTLGGGDDE